MWNQEPVCFTWKYTPVSQQLIGNINHIQLYCLPWLPHRKTTKILLTLIINLLKYHSLSVKLNYGLSLWQYITRLDSKFPLVKCVVIATTVEPRPGTKTYALIMIIWIYFEALIKTLFEGTIKHRIFTFFHTSLKKTYTPLSSSQCTVLIWSIYYVFDFKTSCKASIDNTRWLTRTKINR